LVIFSAASGPPGPNRVNGAVAPGVVGTRVPALARVVLPLRAGVAGRLVAVAVVGEIQKLPVLVVQELAVMVESPRRPQRREMIIPEAVAVEEPTQDYKWAKKAAQES
jgi:hypothetical protein